MSRERELLKELREYLMYIQCNDQTEIDFCNRIDAILSPPEAEPSKTVYGVLSNSNRVNVKETSMNVPNFEQLLKNIAQEKSVWNIKLATTALWAAFYKASK